MNDKELYDFICKCLSPDYTPEFKEEVVNQFSGDEKLPEKFMFACSNNLVIPAVYLRLKRNGLLNIFPADYVAHLREIYDLNKKRNLEILQQADEISRTLATENIIPVYLKGTGNLLDNVYSDTGERLIGDIDLLVQEKDYEKAAELVMGLGYKTDVKPYGGIYEFKHYPRLYRTDVPADIEIHYVPVPFKHSSLFTSEMLFQHKKPISGKENCFVPYDEHKVIHNFIHCQLSNYGYLYKMVPLRDLYDLYLLSQRVNLKNTLEQVEQKEKAKTYFLFAGKMFPSVSLQGMEETKQSRRFVRQHEWFQNHPKVHHMYFRLIILYRLVFVRYLLRIVKAVFSKSSRKHIFNRLKDPGWYGRHFRSIRDSL